MDSWCAHTWGCLWLISQPKEEILSIQNLQPSRYFGELTHLRPSFESSNFSHQAMEQLELCTD